MSVQGYTKVSPCIKANRGKFFKTSFDMVIMHKFQIRYTVPQKNILFRKWVYIAEDARVNYPNVTLLWIKRKYFKSVLMLYDI